jgi:hypothetical protein
MIPAIKGEKGEKGDASPTKPKPIQIKKEETAREQPWTSSILQGRLSEFHFSLLLSYKKSFPFLSFSSKFNIQMN